MALNRSKLDTATIVARYLSGDRVSSIAHDAGITRIAVWQRLQTAQISTAAKEARKWVTLTCAHCRKPFKQRRALSDQSKRAFCSQACYFARRANPNYTENRQGQRIARRVVKHYFNLLPGHVVHHHDTNNANNVVGNLAVFATQADHLKYHHGSEGVVMLWDGRALASAA